MLLREGRHVKHCSILLNRQRVLKGIHLCMSAYSIDLLLLIGLHVNSACEISAFVAFHMRKVVGFAQHAADWQGFSAVYALSCGAFCTV